MQRAIDGKALIGVGRNQTGLALLANSLALECLTQDLCTCGIGLGRAETDFDLEGAIACVPALLRFTQVGRCILGADYREHRHPAARFAAEQRIDRPSRGAPD